MKNPRLISHLHLMNLVIALRAVHSTLSHYVHSRVEYQRAVVRAEGIYRETFCACQDTHLAVLQAQDDYVMMLCHNMHLAACFPSDTHHRDARPFSSLELNSISWPWWPNGI